MRFNNEHFCRDAVPFAIYAYMDLEVETGGIKTSIICELATLVNFQLKLSITYYLHVCHTNKLYGTKPIFKWSWEIKLNIQNFSFFI